MKTLSAVSTLLEERRQGVPADWEERRQGVPADREERRQGVPADREERRQDVPADREVRRNSLVAPRPSSIRRAGPSDASSIHALIAEHLDEGRLLPRDPDEVFLHSHRFVVAVDGEQVLACADLAPLSRTVAEVRSLVVSADARSAGIGRQLIDELVHRATVAGFEKLCAFTHAPAYFVQLGFSTRPARLAAREDRNGLPALFPFPRLRPVRGDAPADAFAPVVRSSRFAAWLSARRPCPPSRSRPLPAESPRHADSSRRRCTAASRPSPARSTSRSSPPTRRWPPPASSPPTWRRRRRCWCRSGTCSTAAAWRERSSSTAAARTRVPASQGLADAEQMARETAAALGCAPSRSWSPRPASSAST